MKELTATKKRNLLSALKVYRRKYLVGKYTDLDESATRLMINTFLTDVLGFTSIDEVKTEYMIRGTYADYIVQVKGKQYFIVEVKSMGMELSAKHLRQAVGYAANEGIEWALLTNGKRFDFYRIIFEKPIDARKVFSIDLSDEAELRSSVETLQCISRSLVASKGLEGLWHRHSALDPANLSRLLFAKPIINYLRRELKRTYKTKFEEEEVKLVVSRIITEKIENVKPKKVRKAVRAKMKKVAAALDPVEALPSEITT